MRARASDEVLWRAFGKHGRRHAGSRCRHRRAAGRGRIARRNRSARRKPSRADIRDARRSSSGSSTALADRAAARLRAHDLAAGRVTRQDPARRFHDLYAPARARAAHPGHRRGVRDGAAPAAASGVPAQPDAALRLLGVGVGDLQDAAAGGSVRRERGLATRGSMRPSTASATASAAGVLTRASLLPRPRAGPASGAAELGIIAAEPSHVHSASSASSKSRSRSRRTRAISI